MTQRELKGLFSLIISPCSEAARWASEQKDQSAEGLLGACEKLEWLEFVARNSSSIAILDKLSRNNIVWVRAAVGSNPATPAGILAGLGWDKSMWVRAEVARNPSTPTATRRRLEQDENPWVREAAIAPLTAPA